MIIYCCKCSKQINARLTSGAEIYPHRPDLCKLPFWKCDNCNNYVGCHHKTKNKTKALGVIPTPEIRNARQHIHKILDPIWKKNKIKRDEIYEKLSKALGYSYHTASIQSIEEARKIYKIIMEQVMSKGKINDRNNNEIK